MHRPSVYELKKNKTLSGRPICYLLIPFSPFKGKIESKPAKVYRDKNN